MLTRRQHDLLTFIADYQERTGGEAPSFEEMQAGLSLSSKSGVHRLLSALEKRRFIRREHGLARAIEVLKLPKPVKLDNAYKAYGNLISRAGVYFASAVNDRAATIIADALNAQQSVPEKLAA